MGVRLPTFLRLLCNRACPPIRESRKRRTRRPASGTITNIGNVSINGGREASNGFMVNGGNVNDGVENATAIVPNLDSISEFRIITNNFDAEYGNFSGVVR